MPTKMVRLWALSALLLGASSARAQESWPDLSKPARATGGGERDSAVVVGVENYFAVPGVPGAKSNAGEWYDYLTQTRGVPPQNVKLLTDADATREEILSAARKAAGQAGAEGTLWFVFVGHGAPSADGKDGLLVGVDAQQKAQSLQTRSVRRGELLKILGLGPAGSIRVVLDACFSGRGQDGDSIAPGLQPLVTVGAMGALDPRIAVLTAAKGNQFAGSLPGTNRPAFSYLVLGGLRGWAAGADGKVTAGSLWSYTKNALAATLRGRDQTPDLLGAEGAVMGASAGEKGPNLAGLAKATAGGFQVTSLAAVPTARAPRALDSAAAGGLNFRNVDIEALKKYDAASTFDKSADAAPEDKAHSWRQLAQDAPKFADMAGKRAAQWDAYAAQKKAADEAEQERVSARDADWGKLSELLALGVVPQTDKRDWSGQFLKAYMKSPGLEPVMAKALAPHAAAGPTREALEKLALTAPKEDLIEWVSIPGGSFMMGSDGGKPDEKPAHRVTVKAFQLAKTEVTNKQYKACVAAGVCSDPGFSVADDDRPIAYVDWEEARKFSKWAGGRLPTEAEWEYAARSGGKDLTYPWGNEGATCANAVISGCGHSATVPVCSKIADNTRQGLCDMAGNVSEWTQDWYHASYSGAPTDGSAWKDTGSHRVSRGGSWLEGEARARSAARSGYPPGFRNSNQGFRLAR